MVLEAQKLGLGTWDLGLRTACEPALRVCVKGMERLKSGKRDIENGRKGKLIRSQEGGHGESAMDLLNLSPIQAHHRHQCL